MHGRKNGFVEKIKINIILEEARIKNRRLPRRESSVNSIRCRNASQNNSDLPELKMNKMKRHKIKSSFPSLFPFLTKANKIFRFMEIRYFFYVA